MPCLAARNAQGRLTLLLGPPGAGKSLLLKVLSGRLQRSKHLRVRPGCLLLPCQLLHFMPHDQPLLELSGLRDLHCDINIVHSAQPHTSRAACMPALLQLQLRKFCSQSQSRAGQDFHKQLGCCRSVAQ